MRTLANYAAAHRNGMRWLVVLCYALINVTGIAIGLMLVDDSRLAAWLILGGILLSGWSLTAYIRAGSASCFGTRKLRSLAFCCATLFFVAGNTGYRLEPVRTHGSIVTAAQAASLPRHAARNGRLSIRERLLQARHWFAEQSAGVKSLLIIAAVLVTLLLIYFWAAICCGIICDGLEALGYFLFFAGTAGAIFGCVRVIQRIVRGPRKRKSAS